MAPAVAAVGDPAVGVVVTIVLAGDDQAAEAEARLATVLDALPDG